MATNVTPKEYILTAKLKKAIIKYLQNEVTAKDIAPLFGTSRQNIPYITNAIFRHAVYNGDIDIIKLLK